MPGLRFFFAAGGRAQVHSLRAPKSLFVCILLTVVAICSVVWGRVVGVHSSRLPKELTLHTLGVKTGIPLTLVVHLCFVLVPVCVLYVVASTTSDCQRRLAAIHRREKEKQH